MRSSAGPSTAPSSAPRCPTLSATASSSGRTTVSTSAVGTLHGGSKAVGLGEPSGFWYRWVGNSYQLDHSDHVCCQVTFVTAAVVARSLILLPDWPYTLLHAGKATGHKTPFSMLKLFLQAFVQFRQYFPLEWHLQVTWVHIYFTYGTPQAYGGYGMPMAVAEWLGCRTCDLNSDRGSQTALLSEGHVAMGVL